MIKTKLFEFMYGMDLWSIPIVLALLATAFSLPLRMWIFNGRNYYSTFKGKLRGFVFYSTIMEELALRLIMLPILVGMFGLLGGISALTISYMAYYAIVYGPVFAADALVIGVLFSYAYIDFGLPVVIAAHLFYKMLNATF